MVQAIATSEEMKPWSVGGEYDRPVPRRIAEEAGVPRELFGQKKYAHSHQWLSNPEHFGEASRADYLAYYAQLRDRAMGVNWLERHFLYSALALVSRTTRRLMKASPGKLGRGVVPLPDRVLVQRMRWEMCFTQHWGMDRIQNRYAVPPAGQQTKQKSTDHCRRGNPDTDERIEAVRQKS